METTIGQRLQAARKRAGYRTQQALADRIGVSDRTVRNWEGGKTIPPDMAALLTDLLGDFAAEGDPVEVAVRQSRLVEWRQDAVITTYKRNLYEQDQEAERRRGA